MYLIASADPHGRFGHQTAVYATGLILAKMTGSHLIKPSYKVFADKWNRVVDWKDEQILDDNSRFAIDGVIRLSRSYSDAYGNRKWDLSTMSEVQDLLNRLMDAKKDSLIFLPFDQFPGQLLRMVQQNEIRCSLSRILSGRFLRENSEDCYACVHIRRGDCTQISHAGWFIDDCFYISLITSLDAHLPHGWDIVVCIQGNHEFLNGLQAELKSKSGRNLRVSASSEEFINEQDIQDYSIMMNANILFTAGSWFSTWAGVANACSTVVEVSRSPDARPYDFLINPDRDSREVNETVLKAIALRKKCRLAHV